MLVPSLQRFAGGQTKGVRTYVAMLWTVILGRVVWKFLDVRMRGAVLAIVVCLIAGWKARRSGLNDIEDIKGHGCEFYRMD